MKEKKWLVPDVIDPAEKVCVQLEIPNDTLHIAAFWGALEQLSKAYNWEDSFADGSATAYVWRDVIGDASELVKTGVNCMLDCDDVEDCLETSTIINIIEGDVIDNTTLIDINTTNVTDNSTEITNIITGGNDTNVYPDLPTLGEPDELCGASYRVAQEIIDLVEQTILDVSAMAVDVWLLGLLALGGWLSAIMLIFWDYIFDNEPSLTGVDFDQYLDQMAEALYCAELDRTQAIADLDPSIPTIRRDALIKGLESVTDAQVALWAFVGAQDDSNDCSAFCALATPILANDSCYAPGTVAGTLTPLGGTRWRGVATWAPGIEYGVLIKRDGGGCFTLDNVTFPVGSGFYYAWETCPGICGSGLSHDPYTNQWLNFGWTSNLAFTVEFDFYGV